MVTYHVPFLKLRRKNPEVWGITWTGGTQEDDSYEQIALWVKDGAVVHTDQIEHLWDYDLGAYMMPTGLRIRAPFGLRCLVVFDALSDRHTIVRPGQTLVRDEDGSYDAYDQDSLNKQFELAI